MAHMPIDDVQTLWNDTPQKNWPALNWDKLMDWLRREGETNDQAKRITVDEARAMRTDCERLQKQGRSFPTAAADSWNELYGKA